MDENTPQGKKDPFAINPNIAAQLDQIKNTIPDTSQPILEFLTAHMKVIVIGCAAVILAVIAYEGVNHYRASVAAKASEDLGVILLEKTEPAARVTALEGFLKDAPSRLKPTVEMELASAAMVAKQYDKAEKAWADLASSTSDEDLKVIAGIGHAKSLLFEGKAKDAQALLSQLKAKAPAAYKPVVDRQLAVAAEAAGDNKTAAAAYAELTANGTDNPGKPYFEFKANQLKTKS